MGHRFAQSTNICEEVEATKGLNNKSFDLPTITNLALKVVGILLNKYPQILQKLPAKIFLLLLVKNYVELQKTSLRFALAFPANRWVDSGFAK